MPGTDHARIREARPDLWALVTRAQAGDADAFGALYAQTRPDVYAYVRQRVQTPELAEDITQAVYVNAWRFIIKITEGAASPHAPLYKIASNLISDHFRQQRRQPMPASNLLDQDMATPLGVRPPARPEDVVIARQLADALWARVGRLDDNQRQVIGLRFAVGLSVSETALAIGQPNEVVRARQHRAMVNLRRAPAPRRPADP